MIDTQLEEDSGSVRRDFNAFVASVLSHVSAAAENSILMWFNTPPCLLSDNRNCYVTCSKTCGNILLFSLTEIHFIWTRKFFYMKCNMHCTSMRDGKVKQREIPLHSGESFVYRDGVEINILLHIHCHQVLTNAPADCHQRQVFCLALCSRCFTRCNNIIYTSHNDSNTWLSVWGHIQSHSQSHMFIWTLTIVN